MCVMKKITILMYLIVNVLHMLIIDTKKLFQFLGNIYLW